MIWFVLGLFLWATLLFLLLPLITKPSAPLDSSVDTAAYGAEIERLSQQIETSKDPSLEARKLDLQRKLIALTDQTAAPSKPMTALGINALCAFVLFGGLGLYSFLGRPELTKAGALVKAPAQAVTQNLAQATEQAKVGNDAPLSDLVAQLETALKGDQKNNPEGWKLYARTLMNAERYDEAFLAYDRVLMLTENDADVKDELERAKSFAQNPTVTRGPTQADINAAQNMSDADRTAMIEGMVEGLAARLEDNPDDQANWVRLLTSRRVLGQTEKGVADIAVMKAHYAKTPQMIDMILAQSGWSGAE